MHLSQPPPDPLGAQYSARIDAHRWSNGMDGCHITVALQAYLRALVRASKRHTYYTHYSKTLSFF